MTTTKPPAPQPAPAAPDQRRAPVSWAAWLFRPLEPRKT